MEVCKSGKEEICRSLSSLSSSFEHSLSSPKLNCTLFLAAQFNMKLRIVFAILLPLPSICIGATLQNESIFYSNDFAYTPGPILDYIKKSEPWKAGRRDILDYGTGNGLLASQLAEAGATSVTAVDISSNAVLVAQKRLEPYPNAIARGTRPLQWTIACPPGAIGYRNCFDTVVSYRGALSQGTTFLKRIEPFTTAMRCAARATREGGKVIVVDFGPDYKTRFKFAYLLALGILAWKEERFRNIASWKLDLGIFISSLPVAGLNILFTITARWISLLKARIEGQLEFSFGFVLASVWSILTIFWLPSRIWVEYQENKKEKTVYKKIMSDAGLTEIKCKRKVLFHPYKRLSDGPGMGLTSLLLNNFRYLMSLNIYEGTKKAKST